MARKKQTSTSRKTKLIADQSAALAEYAAKALVVAEQLRIKTRAVEWFPLDDEERATVTDLPAVTAKLKKKLAKKDGPFTVAEVEEMLEWVGGRFDPEKFDPVKATKAMRKALPDWRELV